MTFTTKNMFPDGAKAHVIIPGDESTRKGLMCLNCERKKEKYEGFLNKC